jgi:hypothetical protein
MNAPLSIEYWQALRRLVEPFELMKFTLIYDGPLPAGQNKRASYAAQIRNKLHPQMRDLWDNHVILRQLTHEARVNNQWMGDLALEMSGPSLPDYSGTPPALKEHEIDLTAPIKARGSGDYGQEFNFLPIVRESLYLACQLDILFLRHEAPDNLLNGGDLDNRIKCFFDALTVPDRDQLRSGEDPHADPLCCLLENDRLISDFSIRTGRLLGKDDKHKYDVRIQAEVTVKVLRVFAQNQCLIGG